MSLRWNGPRGPALLLGALALAACGPAPGGPGAAAPPRARAAASPPAPATQRAAASRPAITPASFSGQPGATQPASAPACGSWIIEYAIGPGTALKITDTMMGAGNGTHAVGPGTAKVRVDVGVDGQPGAGGAQLLELELTTRFTVNAGALGFKTRVATDGAVRFTPDRCGVIARGAFDGAKITWSERARGYRSNGTLNCSGTCGRFGAPPPGRSQSRTGPYAVQLKPFTLGDGLHHLTMPFTQVEHTSSPKQTSLLRLNGQETGRHCAPPPPRCE
ncbi:MAG TPA: hypothetical protein VGQ83_01080 [Polyangia bacterium]